MSRFFQHDTATPPASWWSAEAAGRFLKPADAGEEEAMHAPSAEDMMADVIGHDLAAAAGPLLTHADLDEQTKQRFSDGLARMVSPETLQALASRQTERTRHQLCPAGLLFAPPRIGADDDLPEQAPDFEPLDPDIAPAPPELQPWETALLTAAVLNLAGHPERAQGALRGLDETQDVEPVFVERIRQEREAAALLLGEAKGDLTFGYHRILAAVLGRRELTCDQLVQAVETLDSKSPWRWASLRLALPILLDQAPDALARLMNEAA